ncbi:2-dehydropantoate 2-reductase [Alkalimonas sp. MEB108]|uniref:2-dehydropantoate 2-reductase n=1 Tax=Alkalimonas cellulosilytica TaxID=3058395 RepID=A0ABU7J041_9GAMM|nr:2-dehydropantoate 2-reductase [Alkalimonas sp. MEB108]MEE1999864.1 2-dehydropantoate 2-reductase [Alkalimonas sp. MEB108]
MTDLSSKNRQSWLVVGKGAIGLLAACQLQQQGAGVKLWLRQPAPLTVDFTALDGSRHTHHFEPWPVEQPIETAFIAVKAYDALSCIQQLQPLLAENACLILSHNGLGTLEAIQPPLKPMQQLWFLTTTHGAYIEPGYQAERQVVHSGTGSSVLGAIQPASSQTPKVAKALHQAIGPLHCVADIQPYLWQKLLINCLINPLTALHQVENGELAQPRFAAELTQLLDEFCLLAERAGYPQDKAAAWQQLQQVIAQTASNRSSMLQDRLAGRQTELEFITGFVLREAQRLDLRLPGHQQLYQRCQDAGF